MKTTRLMILSDATDAPPNVGTSYLAHLIALRLGADFVIHPLVEAGNRLARLMLETEGAE